MLKAAGVILVVFSCGAMGFSKSLSYGRRQRQLEEIQKMVVLLLGEITCRREALPEAMERVALKVKSPLADFLREVARAAGAYQGERFSQIFAQKAEEYLGNSGLNSRDREELARLGECLGYLDASTQETTAALYLEELKREIERTNLEAPTKKKLYQSMGILGGIFLALLFL